MGETIHITEYLAFIDTLSEESPIEERLQAAKKWMEARNADTIIFSECYIEENNGELDFQFTVFAGHLKFESSNSIMDVKLQNCRVTGDISFDALRSIKLIDIKDTKIDGKLNIQRNLESFEIFDSTIGGSIELKKDSTIGTLTISNCEAKKISMRGVTIRKNTILYGTIATSPTPPTELPSFDMVGAKFKGFVFCIGVHFKGEANFTNAEFSELAAFSNTTFHHIARFYNTKFSSAALFSKTTFCHEVNFSFSIFSGFVTFQRATFAGSASFFRVIFHYPAVFSHATFENKTDGYRQNLSKMQPSTK